MPIAAEIPVIDISGLLESDAAVAIRDIACLVEQACRTTGWRQ